MTSFSCRFFKYFSTLKDQTIEQLFKHFGGPLHFRGFWHCGQRIQNEKNEKKITKNGPERCSLGCQTVGTVLLLVWLVHAHYDVRGITVDM